MWIRSQDKKILTNGKDVIEIMADEFYANDKYYLKFNDRCVTKKEHTLIEVKIMLDNIQERLENNNEEVVCL